MQAPASPTVAAGECLDFGDYRVLVKRGTVPTLFISAAGIGNPFADTPGEISMVFEWQGAFRRLGAPEHVIFIQDRRRSWFNDLRGWEELTAFLRAYVREHRIARSVAFGLSMGATGAVKIDRELGCDTVVAISPQAIVGVGPGHDARFQFLWERIERIAMPSLAEVMRPDARCLLLFSVDTPEDVRHARALRTARASVTPLAIHGPHNIGVEMARLGKLDEFAAAVVSGDPASLAPFGFFDPDEAIFSLSDVQGAARARAVLALGFARPAQLPEPCFDEYHAALLDSCVAAGESRESALVANPFPVHAAQVVPPDRLVRHAARGWLPAADGGLWAHGASQVLRMRVMDFESRAARLELELVPLVHERHPVQRFLVHAGGITTEHVARLGEPTAASLVIRVELRTRDVEIVIESLDPVSPSALGAAPETGPCSARWTGMRLLPLLAR